MNSPDPEPAAAPTPYAADRDRRLRAARRRTYYARGAAAIAVGVAALILVLESAGVAVWPRSEGYWERITYRSFPNGSTDVFYTGRVDRGDAARLGDALTRLGVFAADRPVSVLLSRAGEQFVVSLFFKAGEWLDPAVLELVQALRQDLSRDAFAGRPVAIQMCTRDVGPFYAPGSSRLDVRKTLR